MTENLLQSYKDAMACLPCGVTIVTTLHEKEPYGITVSSFTSISLQPPIILISIDVNSKMKEAIRKTKRFAVNILSEHQKSIGLRFGTPHVTMKERFNNCSDTQTPLGNPLINNCLSFLDCVLDHEHEVEDHVLFFGKVRHCQVISSEQPILYYRRHWYGLSLNSQISDI